jgi:flagellar basal body P-ring protein FlgI
MKIFNIIMLCAVILLVASGAQAVRIKDIASFEGVRDNQLMGYGLVVGLNGSGDSDQAKIQTQSVVNMLERMGISTTINDIKLKNVAAVMVTATLPPFAKQGNRLDVLVSSLGDAKSIAGGTLIMAPLKGADNTYQLICLWRPGCLRPEKSSDRREGAERRARRTGITQYPDRQINIAPESEHI